ncbi:tyrosine-type recombinase/integrase [Dictyobacter aurantiacus]|uniref:Tyrosine recombinase XerD n=1 Tax=Dictyobacter aurantiacus TaxID=1936993 RepID=A0A401ZAE0_9CHLR|nr:tyrosine-type recombinase/integrase [Dictyobacter aurantiacus]GCE03844.1 tyrosine recombinase XerD [Dictyobacter aurantiacus]
MKITEAINGYIIDCRTRGRSNRTIEWYQQKLTFFANWLAEEEGIVRLHEITTTHLRSFVLHVQEAPIGKKVTDNDEKSPVSPLTVKGYVQVIKGFCSWCVEEELLEKNPASRLKLPSVPDYIIPTFSAEHIKAMLEACDTSTPLGFRDFTIILVLLETGIRVSELCGLRLQDVYEDHIRVFGKGRKEREVGIAPGVSKFLWKYVHQHRKPAADAENLVFVNRHGHPLTRSGIERFLVELKEKAGIQGVRVSAHTFRHTFARIYLEQGGEIYKLSRLMGHSSVEITEEYLKDFDSRSARKEQHKFSAVSAMELLRKKKHKHSN